MSKKEQSKELANSEWEKVKSTINLTFIGRYPEKIRVQHAEAFRTGYIIRAEVIKPKMYEGVTMTKKCAYNWDGVWIGRPELALMLCDNKGIMPEPIEPDGNLCQIGFCKRELKWYGWSSNAVTGFGVGNKITNNDYGFVASNEKEFIADLYNYYNNQDQSVVIDRTKEGAEIYFDKHEVPAKEDLVAPDRSHPYPKEWGKGEWKAESLSDARQMAVDFAKDVADG